MKKEKISNKVIFTKDYSDTIRTNMGSWLSTKSSQLGLAFDIINNIPLQAFNYAYDVHEDLTILSILFNPELLYQGIDKVLNEIKVYHGFPKEYTGKELIIHNRKEFANAVFSMRSDKIIYCILPSDKKTETDDLKFSMEMERYLSSVIRRYLRIEGIKKMSDMIGLLIKKK